MSLPRTPKGVPAGGEFATMSRSDADIVLSDPSAVGGWSIKRFRILGQSPDGMAWTATICHFGRPRMTVSDSGAGDAVELTGMDETAEQDFTRTAHTLLGADTASAGELLRLLRLSHDIDDEARTAAAPRRSVLDVRLATGTLDASDYTLLTA